MNLNLPKSPIYFDLHPADHSLTMYSTVKKVTRQISIQNRVSLANFEYFSIVDKTLNIRQISTTINLQVKKKKEIREIKIVFHVSVEVCQGLESKIKYKKTRKEGSFKVPLGQPSNNFLNLAICQ